MVGLGGSGLLDEGSLSLLRAAAPLLVLAAIGSTTLPSWLVGRLDERVRGWAGVAWQVVVLVLSLAMIATSTNQPFIYFNF